MIVLWGVTTTMKRTVAIAALLGAALATAPAATAQTHEAHRAASTPPGGLNIIQPVLTVISLVFSVQPALPE